MKLPDLPCRSPSLDRDKSLDRAQSKKVMTATGGRRNNNRSSSLKREPASILSPQKKRNSSLGQNKTPMMTPVNMRKPVGVHNARLEKHMTE